MYPTQSVKNRSKAAIMADCSSIRTGSLTSKPALPPFHVHSLEQILFHRDAFSQGQARPTSSHASLQQGPWRTSFPLAIEAGNIVSTSTRQEDRPRTSARRISLGDRNVQILRAINELLVAQVDSLKKQLEETSNSLHERQLDISYMSEATLLAKDEIAELRLQLLEKEDKMNQKGRDEIAALQLRLEQEDMLRQKDQGEIARLKQQLLEKEDIIKTNQKTIEEAKETLNKRDDLIRQKDVEIQEYKNASTRRDMERHSSSREGGLSQNKRTGRMRSFSLKSTTPSRFQDQDCPPLPTHIQSSPSSEPELQQVHLTTEDARPVSKRSHLVKGGHAFKEMIHDQREARARRAAIKANLRANARDEELRNRGGDMETSHQHHYFHHYKIPRTPKLPKLWSVEHGSGNVEMNEGEANGKRSSSFVRFKELISGRRPRTYSQGTREFSIEGSEESSYS